MNYAEILYDVSERIATITLNRPDKLNAWTFSMEKEYRHAMAAAEADSEVRVIIITGAGRGFCAGADMSLLASVQDGSFDMDDATPETSPGSLNNPRADFQKPYSFPLAVAKPIIAAINGACVGLGLVHALYCDIRFASESAKFGTAFVQRGLIAEHGIAWLLPRLVGPQNALDLLYSGRIVLAEEAQRLGLVSRVVPADQLMEEVRAYAAILATNSSPRSMAVMKRQVYESLMQDLGPACDVAIQEMLESFGAEDFREGLMSFMEKRPPAFTGK